MSTRSPMNKRSQNREHTGVARRSAASAKPVRVAAGSVRVAPASPKARRRQLEQGESLQGLSREEKRARRREHRAQEDRIFDASNILMKQDADYRKRRMHFWAIVVVAAVLAVGTILIILALRENSPIPPSVMQLVGFMIAYGILIIGFIYDFVRLRPLRNFYRTQAQGLSDRKLVVLLERAAEREESGRASGQSWFKRLFPKRGASGRTAASGSDGVASAASASVDGGSVCKPAGGTPGRRRSGRRHSSPSRSSAKSKS